MEHLYGLSAKIDAPMMAPTQIVEMAEKVRSQYHADRLQDARIAYVIIPGSERQSGRVSLGKSKALGKVDALLSERDFVITLNWYAWQELDDRERRALLDHELTHCDPKLDAEGDPAGWQIRHHDVEDFTEVVNRRGLWTGDLEALAPVMVRKHKQAQAQQKKLPFKPQREAAAAAAS